MPEILFPWILADADSLVGVVFMLVAFVGWVVNQFNQKKPPVPPRRRPGPMPDQKTVQSEIEKFLSQARQNSPGKPSPESSAPVSHTEQRPPTSDPVPRRAPSMDHPSRSQRENWNEPAGTASRQSSAPRPTSPGRKPTPHQPPRHKSGASSSRPRSASPAARSAEPRPPQKLPAQAGRNPGTGGSPNLLPSADSHVASLLGAFAVNSRQSSGDKGRSETLESAVTPAAELAKKMRSRQSVREAILLSEIMAKPRALRR